MKVGDLDKRTPLLLHYSLLHVFGVVYGVPRCLGRCSPKPSDGQPRHGRSHRRAVRSFGSLYSGRGRPARASRPGAFCSACRAENGKNLMEFVFSSWQMRVGLCICLPVAHASDLGTKAHRVKPKLPCQRLRCPVAGTTLTVGLNDSF